MFRGGRVGVRQRAALDAVASAAPEPVSVLVMRRAIRALRPGDPAKDATDALLRNGYVHCVDPSCGGSGNHRCAVVLTEKGERARTSPVGQWGARARA